MKKVFLKKKNLKKISEEKFERKIKILSLITTIFIGLLTSSTLIYVAYITKKPQKSDVLVSDQIELNRISNQINYLTSNFYQTKDTLKLEEYDNELILLSNAEQAILKKYDINNRSIWPPTEMPIYADSIQRAYLINKHHIKVYFKINFFLHLIIFSVIIFTLLLFLFYKYKLPYAFKKILLNHFYEISK